MREQSALVNSDMMAWYLEDPQTAGLTNRVFAGESAVHFEEWIAVSRGEKRLITIERTPVIGEDGYVHRVVCAAADITRNRQIESLLRRREQDFKALAENPTDFVTRVGRDLRRVYTNPAVTSAFWVSQEEALGQDQSGTRSR